MLFSDPNLALLLSLLALGVMGLIIVRYRTVLLGFTFFSFFNIASASLAAFLMSTGFNLSSSWLTNHHLQVINYTAMGLLAFSAGVWLAWRPIAGETVASVWKIQTTTSRLPFASSMLYLRQSQASQLPWLNLRFAMLCLGLSVAAYLLTPFAYSIPSLRALWSNFHNLLPLGLLIVLLVCQISRSYTPLFVALLIFIPIVLLSAVNTGHIGIGGSFLVQLLLVATFALGIRLRTLPLFVIGTIILTSLLVGWLTSRSLIRSGDLSQYGQLDRIGIFLREFTYINPLDLTPEQVQEMVRLRVDMTDILAAQVFYQPQFEPYAYGSIITDQLAASLIPRFIWPDKPAIVGGSEFVARFTGLDFGANVSVGLPYQFELYANGGVPVVIVGLFILGWLTARLELYTVTGSLSLPWFLVLTNSVYTLANGAQTIVVLIVTLVAGCIGYYVLGHVLMRFNPVYNFWQEPLPKVLASHPPSSAPSAIIRRPQP